MEDYLKIYNIIKNRYISFITTTIGRQNYKLKEEIKKYYEKDFSISTPIYIENKINYEKADFEQIKKLDFNKKLLDMIINEEFPKFSTPYIHQYHTWYNLLNFKHTILSTGTGSGKTESFIFPILNYIINNYDNSKTVKALIIYPLKALTFNQHERIVEYIQKINNKFNLNITCKIIDGDVSKEEKNQIIEQPPDILLTNYSMLDIILLNPKYKPLINKMKLKYMVLDELHTYRGAQGIDISYLIKRLQFNLLQIGINNIIYIGTSATLIDTNSNSFNEVINFCENIFNVKFDIENIIISKSNNTIKQYDVSEIKQNDNYKIHTIFTKPTGFYRCLSCGTLNSINEINNNCCKKCNSKLLFELYTCRNCGFEYYNYNTESLDKIDNSININDKLFRNILDNKFLEYTDKKIDTKNILFFIDENNKIESKNISEFKLCKKCKSIYAKNENSCPNCNSNEHLTIKIYNKENEKYINFNKRDVNTNYCVNCNFKKKNRNSIYKLIANTNKISNENSSHIIFDELYSNLETKKILIFTDNVQKSSKFARELYETHIKNIIRKELLDEIKKINDFKKFRQIKHNISDKIDDVNDISGDYIRTIIEKEIYDQVIAKNTKVGSLINRKWIDISFIDYNNKNKLEYKILDYLLSRHYIDIYYEIYDKLEYNLNEFNNKKELIEKLHNKLKVDSEIISETLEKLKDNNYIILKNNIYLLKESKIIVKKNDKIISESDNYYDNWNYNIQLMKTENDTAKTDKDKRKVIEKDFKNKSDMILVATPTLELGIDIGDLNCVGQLNTPRSAANYVQRAGRAGRKSEKSIVITYLEDSSLGGYYFYNPKELISGNITPPLFNINLEYPASKSLFSLFLQTILQDSKFLTLVNNNWSQLYFWIKNKDVIKEYWIKKYNDEFKELINIYNINIYNINKKIPSINMDNLINDWIKKLDSCVTLAKEINSNNQSSSDFNTINYFRLFNLLPDFAFGSSTTFVKVKSTYEIISGFPLKQTCPLNSIDFNKKKYNCKKISVRNKKLHSDYNIFYGNKFKKCDNCQYIEYNDLNKINCPLCGNKLTDVIENKTLFKPVVIEAKRNKYFTNSKIVDWKTILINLPDNYKESNIFKCEIGLLFNGIKNSYDNYKICSICGLIYNSKDPKGKNHKHEPLNAQILDKYNTIAKYINFNNYLTNNNKDNLYKLNKTMYNTLIASVNIVVGCEDGEIDVAKLTDNPFEYIFFDTVEGGVGFVDVFNTRLYEIIEKSIELCEQKCCKNGCVKCIGSYNRQLDLDYLKKKELLPILYEIKQNINKIR